MLKTITVTNAAGEPSTTAEILIENNLTETPKVSVIIPVYNVAAYLPECLDSIINQTLKEIEIICVDDGSTDNSLEILKEYAQKDHRITVISQQNLHAGIARNAGIAIAKGTYLSFLDSDDFFEPDMLQTLHNTISQDKSDIAICGYYIYDDVQKKDTQPRIQSNKNTYYFPQQTKNWLNITPAPWNKLFKADLFSRYNIRFENLYSCNDVTATYTALSAASKISILPDLFIHYRINTKTQITAKRNQYAPCVLYALDKLEKNLLRLNLYNIFKHSLTKVAYGCIQYETSRCSSEQSTELKQKTSQILSKQLYRNIKKLYSQKKTRHCYLFGFIPLLKITEK